MPESILPECADVLDGWRSSMQEVALLALGRNGFFDHAAVYGGAALHLLYGSPRCARNLDFRMLRQRPGFAPDSWSDALVQEFDAYGLPLTVISPKKAAAYGSWRRNPPHDRLTLDFVASQAKILRLTLSVALRPAPDLLTEELPMPDHPDHHVRCVSLPEQLAITILLLLCRPAPAEWFDFSWFVRKGVALDFTRFLRHASYAGSPHYASISVADLRRLLRRQLISLRPQYGRHGFMRLAADTGISFEEIHEAVDGMAIA